MLKVEGSLFMPLGIHVRTHLSVFPHFNAAHFRRHEIPQSGIWNPELPLLVSFVSRNRKTNLKGFRIPHSRFRFPASGVSCLRKRAVVQSSMSESKRAASSLSGVGTTVTAQFRRHETPESGNRNREWGIRNPFRFVFLFRETKETSNGNSGFQIPDSGVSCLRKWLY